MSTTIVKLENSIQHYAWGSRDAIARLQQRATPSPEPEAELWIGDHPHAPSRVREAGGTTALPEWLSRDPDRLLGRGCVQLPFLTKVLAAARSLSLQVHPDPQQARTGFERETRAAVPNAERCYHDPEGKHEVLIALSRFEALCGFRADAEVAAALVAMPRTAKYLDSADPGEPLALALFERLLQSSEVERRVVCEEASAFATRAGSREADWIGRLLEEHPDDPLAVAPLFMNPVVLEPGAGLVVRPGVVHSYMSGTGVEVMTRSDNVVRGGLTQKHVDGRELLRISQRSGGPIEPIEPEALADDGCESRYATGTNAFGIRLLSFAADRILGRRGGQVAVLLCIEGAVDAGGVELSPGEAALVPAGVQGYDLKGSARTNRVFEVSSG
ncbi:MAG: mannose-6-phosphate isomerase, class I [Myxococcota bacterium]|nr:mannose-6-phosphate isomerase, class I [Myxococcota bacterium]